MGVGFPGPRAALLAAALALLGPSCGAAVVHRIPEDFQDHATVVEGTVVRAVPVHKAFLYNCRDERGSPSFADWERVQVRVARVWVGYVADDTLSVLRPTGAGHGLSGAKPGARMFTTSCDGCRRRASRRALLRRRGVRERHIDLPVGDHRSPDRA